MSFVDKKCSFAFAGTYGHECGAPALFVGVMRSEHTKSGTYYAGRCASCKAIKGGENGRVIRFEPIDPARHVNEWRAGA
jgi:hypothetical protein